MKESDVLKALHKKYVDHFCINHVKSGPTWFNGNLGVADFIAIKKSWSKPCITCCEVKVSRSDFLGDRKWPSYLDLCHEFYFACPKGNIITKKDIETIDNPAVGLLHVNADTGHVRTVKKPLYRDTGYNPDLLMYIIMNRLDSDRIPFYNNKTDLWRDWLAGKENARHIGHQVGGRLPKELADALGRAETAERQLANKKELLDEIEKELGITSIWNISSFKREIEQVRKLSKDTYTFSQLINHLEAIGKIMAEKDES